MLANLLRNSNRTRNLLKNKNNKIKIFLYAQQIILECGLWNQPDAAVCLCCCRSHLMHQPQTIFESQSPQMAVLSVFHQPASSLFWPSGPSLNHHVALSPRKDQAAAAWPEDHPCPPLPHATTIFITPIFRGAWQSRFCKLWLGSRQPVGKNLYFMRFYKGTSGVN